MDFQRHFHVITIFKFYDFWLLQTGFYVELDVLASALGTWKNQAIEIRYEQ